MPPPRSSIGLAVKLPADIPADAVPFLHRVGYLDADRLAPGCQAPDLALSTPAGEVVRLSAAWAAAPAVLIFGSYT
jgi:hypothetical protein